MVEFYNLADPVDAKRFVESEKVPTCVAVLWGAKDGFAFTNWYCGAPATKKIGDGWYCDRHIKTGEASQSCEGGRRVE